jgi:hypothetical protein
MARLATMVDDTEPWKRIRADLFKSVMIAGGNAITASVIINVAHLDYLLGLGVAFGCGFGGVDALRGFWSRAMRAWVWLKGHALEDVGKERDGLAREAAIRSLMETHKLDVLARQVDRMNDKDGTTP